MSLLAVVLSVVRRQGACPEAVARGTKLLTAFQVPTGSDHATLYFSTRAESQQQAAFNLHPSEDSDSKTKPFWTSRGKVLQSQGLLSFAFKLCGDVCLKQTRALMSVKVTCRSILNLMQKKQLLCRQYSQ